MKALVTGANKGIGFEIARSLGKRGYDILVGARDEARGQAAVEKLVAEDLSATFIRIVELDKPSGEQMDTFIDFDSMLVSAFSVALS